MIGIDACTPLGLSVSVEADDNGMIYIKLSTSKVHHSEILKPGLLIDRDFEGHIVGVEIEQHPAPIIVERKLSPNT